jgi:hypothetical protein
MIRHSIRIAPLVVAGLLVSAMPALAGPPLLCHPFDIGAARSLPWDGTHAWWAGQADYNVQNLVADTEALLTPSTPVIVRMETLRRAAIYASQDGRIAARLLNALTERAMKTDRAGASNALALFDAGYLAETFKQITSLGQEGEFRGRAETVRGVLAKNGTDGSALVNRSLSLTAHEPALEFAAALIAASGNRSAYREHAEKARKGASQDALLARNIKHLNP